MDVKLSASIFSLILLFLVGFSAANKDRESEWPSSGDGNAVDEDEDDVLSSGDGEEDFDEEEEEEVDENNLEGSAFDADVPEDVPPTTTRSRTLTRCQQLRNSKQNSDRRGYRPQCTASGAFEPMQCYQDTNECWCVDSEGNQLGELYRLPAVPTCPPDSGVRRPDDMRPTARSDFDDFVIIEVSSTRPPVSVKTTKTPIGERFNVEPDMEPLPPKNWFDFLLHHPLILGAVIGGSILLLVMMILILMFCIYRMRKKDEGSYSLNEPRQTFNYTRAKDQEFFA